MSGACFLAVLSLLGRTEKLLTVEVSVEKERYFRSSRSIVEDLTVGVTVKNLSDATALRFPAPSVGLLRGTRLTVLFYRPAFRKWVFEPLFPWFKKGQKLAEPDVDELVRIIESGKLPARAAGQYQISLETSRAMREIVPSYFKRTIDMTSADLGEVERRLRAGEGPFLVTRRVPEALGARAGAPDTAIIPPGESKSFELDVGAYFDFYEGGTYGVACSILGVVSNVAKFDVLPVMRTDLRADEIMPRLAELEDGEPRYETMFYLCRAPFAWDEVVYVRGHVPPHTSRLVKATKGPGGLRFQGLTERWPNYPWPEAPRYELKRLSKYKAGTTPRVRVSGRKIALLFEDALEPVYWLYTVDFSRTPARIERRKAGQSGGPEPSLGVDEGGQFQVM